MLKGKPNVTKVRINFLERAHPVFGCEFYWYMGKHHNFERGKHYVKYTYRLDRRAEQIKFWLEVMLVLIIRSGPTKLSQ